MKFSIILGITVAVFSTATTVSGAMSLDDSPKPVFLYAGPKDDAGWHQSVDQARTNLEPVLHVTIPYAETVAEADIKDSVENFIKRGRNIVIDDSPRYSAAFADLVRRSSERAQGYAMRFFATPGVYGLGFPAADF